jgi:hypothetical protein
MVLSKTLVFAASLVCTSLVEASTATSVSTVPDLQRRADPIPTFTFRPVEKYLIKKVSCLLLPTIHILNAFIRTPTPHPRETNFKSIRKAYTMTSLRKA